MYLIGNSMVRGIRINHPMFMSTFAFPGADWEICLSYITPRKEQFRNSLIYISVGPTPLTSRVPSTREVVPKTTLRAMNMEEFILNVKASHNINIVICTLTPMEFNFYNSLRATERPNADLYSQWTEELTNDIVKLNGAIIETNRNAGVITPFTHKWVLHNANNHYTFRWWYLADGLHLSDEAKRRQETELLRNLECNLAVLRGQGRAD